ncbi:uncharacterized protein LOC114352017 [Ostrinia furnacalis]|uniref:uncharacterized protein LOC114352017 n=1 Tax=Ostrinia furnacalis TaxID=93504 RepID=UPI00103BA954|nr:uncharacterized protein LOC114352017 [Ostrinia furnacalis]
MMTVYPQVRDPKRHEEQYSILREWACPRGVPDSAARALAAHEYTLGDLLAHAQREDIARLQLKGGVELRLWRAILDHRLQSTTNHLRRASSTETDMDTNSIVVVECNQCKTTRRTTSNNSSCSNNPTIVIRDQVNGEDDVTELVPANGDSP